MDFRDQLWMGAATVAMEAQGESWEGKLGVAFVLVGRPGSIMDAALKRLQFSCWNSDSTTRAGLDDLDPRVWEECYKAACAAYFALVPDPTHGATHYLNPVVVRQINNGVMPSWYDPARVTATIGRHEFLKLD